MIMLFFVSCFNSRFSTVAIGMLFSAGLLLYSHIGFVFVNTTTLESHGSVCLVQTIFLTGFLFTVGCLSLFSHTELQS